MKEMKMNTKPIRTSRLASVALVLLLFCAATVTPAAAAGSTHVVSYGDTLADIAYRYGTTATSLMIANGLSNPNFIWTGQRLTIPGSGSSTSASSRYHTVSWGDTLADIAYRYGTSVGAIMSSNGLGNATYIETGWSLVIPGSSSPGTTSTPSSGSKIHYVQYGETLADIALRYGTNIWAIAQATGLSDIDHIVTGQRLVVPGSGSTPAPAPAPTGGKWIDVDVSAQMLTAYVGDTAVRSIYVSTGRTQTPTPLGRYTIQYKLPFTDMSGPGYYQPDVPWVMVFYGDYSIHGAYWHNNFGQRMSHGCVNLPVDQAQWLYGWAPSGTAVVIHS
jgi:LysM repeat protein